MDSAEIVRPFGDALLSRLLPRPRTTSDYRETGERGRARRCLVDRRFHNPAEKICASARQIVAANDVYVLSRERGHCSEGTCRSDSVFGWIRVYPSFRKSVARKYAEIRRVCRCDRRPLRRHSSDRRSNRESPRRRRSVYWVCRRNLLRHGGGNRGIHLLNLRDHPTRWFTEINAGIAQLVEQLICNSSLTNCARFRCVAQHC
jgi:hypothetical protein